jgi:hypothetical protein
MPWLVTAPSPSVEFVVAVALLVGVFVGVGASFATQSAHPPPASSLARAPGIFARRKRAKMEANSRHLRQGDGAAMAACERLGCFALRVCAGG